MNNEKSIFELDLHEELQINQMLSILSVPDGWIYKFKNYHGDLISSTFVPDTDK